MPIYFGFAESLDKTTNKWATPANAPTCNAQGWNGSTPTDLGAVTAVAWATGRYYALKDTSATIYQKVTFAFHTGDADYADATAECSYEVAMMGMTAAKVAFIDASIDAVPTAAEVWATTPRKLTQTATEILASVTGDKITQIKGDTWDFDIEDVTLDANLIQLSIKSSKNNTDAESLVFIDTDTGLLYLNGVAATGVGDIPAAADGSLSYTGTTLTVTLKATASALLPYGSDYKYGLQSITAAGVVAESYGGTFVITDDVVDATS